MVLLCLWLSGMWFWLEALGGLAVGGLAVSGAWMIERWIVFEVDGGWVAW